METSGLCRVCDTIEEIRTFTTGPGVLSTI